MANHKAMKRKFKITEFTTEPHIPPQIAEKILTYHIEVMNPIRYLLGSPIIVSEKSGYRSVETEIRQGRSGNSEHTFKGKGAADYTTPGDLNMLGKLLKDSPYTRICYYPTKGFYHCDYKGSERILYISEDGSKWTRRDW